VSGEGLFVLEFFFSSGLGNGLTSYFESVNGLVRVGFCAFSLIYPSDITFGMFEVGLNCDFPTDYFVNIFNSVESSILFLLLSVIRERLIYFDSTTSENTSSLLYKLLTYSLGID
jgi:hypothetical protein